MTLLHRPISVHSSSREQRWEFDDYGPPFRMTAAGLALDPVRLSSAPCRSNRLMLGSRRIDVGDGVMVVDFIHSKGREVSGFERLTGASMIGVTLGFFVPEVGRLSVSVALPLHPDIGGGCCGVGWPVAPLAHGFMMDDDTSSMYVAKAATIDRALKWREDADGPWTNVGVLQ